MMIMLPGILMPVTAGSASLSVSLEAGFLLYTCFFLKLRSLQLSRRRSLTKFLTPGPALASTTWPQWRPELTGSFLNRLTSSTHALQISPRLGSDK